MVKSTIEQYAEEYKIEGRRVKLIEKAIKVFEVDIHDIDLKVLMANLVDRDDDFLIDEIAGHSGIQAIDKSLKVQQLKGMTKYLKEKEIKEEKELIESWKKEGVNPIELNEKTNLINSYVDMVAKKLIYGSFIYGLGGTGKTSIVMSKLLSLNINAVYLNCKITPLELYIFLYQNKDKDVIVMDNCLDINNDTAVKIIDSALEVVPYGTDYKRIISYHSSAKQLKDYPAYFEMDSGIIIIDNRIKANDERVSALLTKIPVIEHKLTYKEIIAMLEEFIKKQFYKFDVSEDERKYALSIIKENTSPFTINLSLRILKEVYAFVKYNREKAVHLLKSSLKTEEEYEFIYQMIKEKISTEQQIEKWKEKYPEKKSRATYFLYKKKLMEKLN